MSDQHRAAVAVTLERTASNELDILPAILHLMGGRDLNLMGGRDLHLALGLGLISLLLAPD